MILSAYPASDEARPTLAANLYPLVIAVGAVVGAGGYFLWPVEPSLTAAAGLSTALAAGGWLARGWPRVFVAMLALLAMAIAFTYTTWRVQSLDTHILPQQYSGERHWVVGRIVGLDNYGTYSAMTVEDAKVYGLPAQAAPKKLRISTFTSRVEKEGLILGGWVAAETKLSAPTSPAFPGDWPALRQAWLEGEGAGGFVMGGLYATSAPDLQPWDPPFMADINTLRETIATRLAAGDGDGEQAARAVAAALLTGLRGDIPDEVRDHFRHSGLAHLLAISGLHLGLVGGLMFFAGRRLIGAVPNLALHVSTKKLAAVLGLAVTFFYMLLAGATIPTLRAFIMIGLLFVAVLLERLRMGLRVLCLAALIVLAIWPESVITPSFQMSFAAALALVLWAEYQPVQPYSRLAFMRGVGYMQGVWACGVVAGLATMPIAAWHFNMVSFMGFFANLLAIPLTGFWIMPAGVAALLAMPFGLEAPFVWLMVQGVEVLLYLAAWAADSPLAGVDVGAAVWPLVLVMSLALLLLAFWQRWRVFWPVAVASVALVLLLPTARMPDILWLRGGQTVLVRATQEGQDAALLKPQETRGYVLAAGDGHREQDAIVRRLARQYHVPIHETPLATVRCDALGCSYPVAGQHVLVMAEGHIPDGEDCRLATLIFTSLAYINPAECQAIFNPADDVQAAGLNLNKHTMTLVDFTPGNRRIWHHAQRAEKLDPDTH